MGTILILCRHFCPTGIPLRDWSGEGRCAVREVPLLENREKANHLNCLLSLLPFKQLLHTSTHLQEQIAFFLTVCPHCTFCKYFSQNSSLSAWSLMILYAHFSSVRRVVSSCHRPLSKPTGHCDKLELTCLHCVCSLLCPRCPAQRQHTLRDQKWF